MLNGRVVSLIKSELNGMHAHLLNGKDRIAEVTIAADGSFSVSDLKPGVYDLVALGPDGIAAVSFEAVAHADNVENEAYTALQDMVYDSMDVALAQPMDYGVIGGNGGGMVDNSIVYASNPIEYAGECVSCGVAAGTSCGGCCNFSNYASSGCCGGGRGFGGFGGLLGGGLTGRRLGLLGLAIALPLALSDDDSDQDGGVSPNNL